MDQIRAHARSVWRTYERYYYQAWQPPPPSVDDHYADNDDHDDGYDDRDGAHRMADRDDDNDDDGPAQSHWRDDPETAAALEANNAGDYGNGDYEGRTLVNRNQETGAMPATTMVIDLDDDSVDDDENGNTNDSDDEEYNNDLGRGRRRERNDAASERRFVSWFTHRWVGEGDMRPSERRLTRQFARPERYGRPRLVDMAPPPRFDDPAPHLVVKRFGYGRRRNGLRQLCVLFSQPPTSKGDDAADAAPFAPWRALGIGQSTLGDPSTL